MNEAPAMRNSSLPSLTWQHSLVGMVLVCGSVQALTLGSLRGEALIGRPLSVNVPVQLDAGEVASAVCVDAEVQFADNRIDGGRVRSSWLNPDATGEGVFRVETVVPVDEPVVSIQVRAGCIRKTSRKYVLLADVPTDGARVSAVTLPQASGSAVIVPAAASVKKDESPQAVAGSTNTASVSVGRVKKDRVPRQKPVVTDAPAAAVSAESRERESATVLASESSLATSEQRPKAKAAVAPKSTKGSKGDRLSADKSRLTLDALSELNPNLKSSFELVTSPSDEPQAREAAKALWRSLNALPEDVSRDSQRVQALEAQIKALQSNTVQNEQAQTALKEQLSKAEDERYANALVGVLSALLLCAVGAAGYFWFRLRNGRFAADHDWWRGQSIEPSVLSDLAPAGDMNPLAAGVTRDSKHGRASRSSSADVSPEDSIFDSLQQSKAAQGRNSRWQATPPDSVPPRSGFFHSSLGTRSVNVEELFDIQQQAEFFVSLGQHEQAINLLQQHIYGATSTSGLAYLDLLQLYHQFERRTEYDQLREEFNRLFMAQVPTFDNYKQQSRGIARYSSTMARIEAHWKTPQILEILQELIFRQPEAGVPNDGESFDLTAYRELMLLFAIAKDLSEASPGVTDAGHAALGARLDAMAEPAREDDAPSRFAHSRVGSFVDSGLAGVSSTRSSTLAPAPKSRFDAVEVRDSTLPANISVPKASPRLGLDVDLFELESEMSPLDMGLDAAAESRAPLDFSLPEEPALAPLAPDTVIEPDASRTPAAPVEMDLDLEQYLSQDKEFLAELAAKAKK